MSSLEITLEIRPEEIDRDSIDNLTVVGRVRNAGREDIRPEVHRAALSINGQDSLTWSLAIGNGPLEDEKRTLHPGQSVEFSRVMGRTLFHQRGEYSCVLRLQGIESAPVTVAYR